jgi:hypothetical protein
MSRNNKVLNVFGGLSYENPRYASEDNPWDMWDGMPHYDPANVRTKEAYASLEVEFEEGDEESVQKFAEIIEQTVTDRSKTLWYPKLVRSDYTIGYSGEHHRGEPINPDNYPKYPFYIVSKSRWDVRMTSESLIEQGIKHYMVVEESQLEKYAAKVDPNWVTLITIPQKYFDEYDTFDDLGNTKSKGPGPARNFAWEHSMSLGYKRHWVLDDNQRRFFRSQQDMRYYNMSAAMWRAMEDHTDRFENVYISGPHYKFFVVPDKNRPPFLQNCRIYSTLLIRNDIPYRWRGRYNEDTDLSLRVLKDGFCTIQYNAFSTGKLVTQAVKGGNTEAFYGKEGTLPKSQMLVDMHPDVAELKWMHGRWHHYVDYSPFRKTRLIYAKDYHVNPDSEYGMKLEKIYIEETELDEEVDNG